MYIPGNDKKELALLPNSMDNISIEVTLNGKEYCFVAAVVTVGYTHRFIVTINDLEVMFEPDEERSYRAILPEKHLLKATDHDKELIIAIGEVIQSAR